MPDLTNLPGITFEQLVDILYVLAALLAILLALTQPVVACIGVKGHKFLAPRSERR